MGLGAHCTVSSRPSCSSAGSGLLPTFVGLTADVQAPRGSIEEHASRYTLAWAISYPGRALSL